MSLLDETFAQMGTEKSGSAGNEDSLDHSLIFQSGGGGKVVNNVISNPSRRLGNVQDLIVDQSGGADVSGDQRDRIAIEL